jgi:hypothetical protein
MLALLDVDFGAVLDLVAKHDYLAAGLGVALIALYFGLKLLGRKYPAALKAARALTRAEKVLTPDAEPAEAPKEDAPVAPAAGANSVLGAPVKLDEPK